MPVIKLDAISSTNDFLKELATSHDTANYTVVTAQMQYNGRGQMGAKWHSEKGKNLIMSMLISDIESVEQLFSLNVLIALSITKLLNELQIPDVSVKWPNDIMSGNKKLGGILIENTFRSTGEIQAIAGIGLNVNQVNFDALPKASSLCIVGKNTYDLDQLVAGISSNIVDGMYQIKQDASSYWDAYHHQLYKIDKPMPFEDAEGRKFMGMIRGVSVNGKLQLQLEDDSIMEYGIKEIQMLY